MPHKRSVEAVMTADDWLYRHHRECPTERGCGRTGGRLFIGYSICGERAQTLSLLSGCMGS